jgi:hypothetical protein
MKIRNKYTEYSVEHEGQLFQVRIHVGPSGKGGHWTILAAVGWHQHCRFLNEDGKKFKAVKAALTAILPPTDLVVEA